MGPGNTHKLPENAASIQTLFLHRDFLSNSSIRLTQTFKAYSVTFFLLNHQEALEEKSCKGNPCGSLGKMCRLNECGKHTNQGIYVSTREIIDTGEKFYGCKESGDFLTQRSHLSGHVGSVGENPVNIVEMPSRSFHLFLTI